MTDAGELFVKLRPSTAGFTAEAEGPITKAGKDLSKAFLAAFAVTSIAEGIKGVAEAATKQNSAFAVLDRTLRDAGQSTKGFSSSLQDVLEVRARGTGISAEDLAQSLGRIVSETHNTSKALTDLSIAENLSRQRHIDLSVAALAVAKAETGSFTSLQRYIGLIPKVTTNVDALKTKYTALTESGGKLDASQKAIYASALKSAEAADKAATSQNAIGLAQQKSAGAAQVFANTYEGQFERLHVSVDQLKVAVGTSLVSGLATGAAGIADFTNKLLESDKVQKDAKQAAHDIGGALHDLKAVAETVGPPLLTVTDHLGGVTKAVELLGGTLVANNIVSRLTAVGAAETVVGDDAVVSATKVDLLRGSLTKLGQLGAIAVTVAVGFEEAKYAHQALTTQAVSAENKKGANGSPYNKGTPLDDLYQQGQAGGSAPKSLVTAAFSSGLLAFNAGKDELDKRLLGLPDDVSGTLAAATAKAKPAAAAAGADLLASLASGVAADKADLATLKQNMADAVSQGALAIDQAVDQAKQNFTAIGQSLAASIGTYLTKPLTDAATALGSEGDRIALQFDTVTAKLSARATVFDEASQRLQLASQARQAQFAGEDALLTQEQNRAGLTSDRQSLANLRHQIILPGGEQLSSNLKTALGQLDDLQRKLHDPALAAFITQFQGAGIAVTRDKIGIATTPNPKEAQHAADLGVESGRNALEQAGVAARRQMVETGLQLKREHLTVLQDAAALETVTATTMIANLTDLFDKGKLKFASFSADLDQILARHHITVAGIAKIEGVAAADAFSGQILGLGEQAAALSAGPQRVGSGLVPSIVRPLDALNQATKQIASIAKEQRDKQLDEAKKQTKLLTTLAGQQKAKAFTTSLERNHGAASKLQQDMVGVAG